jgi:membrane protease YdiL (CAAX protease family)
MRDKLDWRGVLRPGKWLPLRATAWGFGLVAIIIGAASLAGLALRRLGMPKDGPLSFVALILVVAALLGAYALAVRLGERRAVSELAPTRLLPELAGGLLFGVALFSLVIAVLLACGTYTLSQPPPGTPWRGLQLGFGAGFLEELVFRGVLMRLLWEAFGARVAVAVSATLFGLAHLLNPHPDIVGASYIILEAGLMLAALYVLTGRLWASIGTHAGWNFAQGYIWGAEVSGTDPGGHLLLVTPRPGASALLTGGAFGPEASLAALVVGTTAGVLLLGWVWRRRAAAAWAVP